MYRSRYYPDRWNPYNRHDTGMYVVYRTKDHKYLGTITNCHSEKQAERIAKYQYGEDVWVSAIEE